MQRDDPHGVASPMESGKAAVNIFVCGAQFVSGPLKLLTTRPGTMGRRYFGMWAGLGLMFFPFTCTLLVQVAGLNPMAAGFEMVLPAWVALIAVRVVHLLAGAAERKRLRRAGGHVHTLFVGKGYLPFLPKPANDFALCVALGTFFAAVLGSEVLGCYALLAAGGSVADGGYQEAVDDARIEQALDAQAEAEVLSQQIAQRRGGR